MSEGHPVTYEQSGVDYSKLDPFKIAAQRAALSTTYNLERFGYQEVTASRGESAYVWDEGDKYGAMVTEGLGTKNLVADAMRQITGRTHYDDLAQDTVAMIVNDLITVGAMPKVVSAHMSVENADWFKDEQRYHDLVTGWAKACELAGATWGPGETPALKGILQAGTIELSGSAVGEIKPKDRLTLGDKLRHGDLAVYLPSSGIHANGLTMAREIAANLAEGYATKLSDGTRFGDALLTPTPVYVDAIRRLFEAGVDIHYMVNVTGHGWRKLMRAERQFSYLIGFLPEDRPPVFDFIQQHSKASDEEMYGNFNMGAGFIIYVDFDNLGPALKVLQSNGYAARLAGHIEEGPKRVVIKPKSLVFEADSLNLR